MMHVSTTATIARKTSDEIAPGFVTTPLADSAAARSYLPKTLRPDLTDRKARSCKRLPYAPSRWYLTGFLVSAGAPSGQL